MKVDRRIWLAAAGALPFAPALAATARAAPPAPASPSAAPRLPATSEFGPMAVAYLDSGTMHPFARGARRAVDAYLAARALDPGAVPFGLDDTEARVRAKFAALVGADAAEICLVPSTTAGEQLVLQALDIPGGGGRVVTDSLHFFGSFYLYEEMAKGGVEVTWLKPRDGRSIAIADVEAAVTRGVKLVALSLVSTFNGFEHDLKRVCEIAHAHGAYVYADIIHAAGAVPLDLHASGVDFAACAGYKWLMGDFGLGFLYARAGVLDQMRRPVFGYYQLDAFRTHVYPGDPPGESVADYTPRSDATGHFAVGTTSGAGIAQLDWSLEYIAALGVEAIARHRRPLLERARAGLERKGFRCLTPEGSRTPLLAFERADAAALAPRLKAAGVKIALGRNRFRIAPSVFNTEADIDRLLEAFA